MSHYAQSDPAKSAHGTHGGPGRPVTIRRARPADAGALAGLAVLDDVAPLEGEVIVAEIESELWAARSLADGRTIADPFRPADEARALLALRAAHLNGRALRRASRERTWRRAFLRQQPS